MKTTSKLSESQRERTALPEDACPECGNLMKKVSGTLSMPVHNEEVRVPRVGHLVCPKCGERVLNLRESQDFQRRALELFRHKYGLLSPDEIREIRDRHGLTQGDLASLLRLGAVTLSRWESGRFVQTASMDVLLRLIRDVPATLPHLKQRAA